MEIVYQILDLLHQGDSHKEFVEILNSMPKEKYSEALDALTYMKSEGLVSGNLQSNEIVHLTLKGKTLLKTHKEDLEDKVKQRNEYIANRRSDRCFQVISAIITGTIIAFISAIINIIIYASGS